MKFIEYTDGNGIEHMLNLKHVINIRNVQGEDQTDFYMSDGLKIRAYHLGYLRFYHELENLIDEPIEHFVNTQYILKKHE
jgi:hypothetical protein